ncbi:NADPH-dependent FMN reductase [Lacicoccus alkaliphilus]|uniref:FMN reductase n=1 Tax=Lacicoccus alkaliphilus DSM 16010 TaxID=1123231 RepID=A0A1M7K2E7_9BACL|nr:NADPH-dependent FMN reductase [Salinicoccus alkaliphilus]SHM59460.1 FMN reductase [Salinicoccus alkaliphilus DSM 16010]
MNILVLSGSNAGNKTRIATTLLKEKLETQYSTESIEYINLQDVTLPFSDGRNYMDYGGDATEVLTKVMAADVLFIGSPIFQASMPASLKNVFDLLPRNALEGKTVSMLITAGSDKHFLIPEYNYKPVLSYLKANIVPRYVFMLDTNFHDGALQGDDVHLRLDRLIDDTMVLARTYEEIRVKADAQFGF